MDRTLAGKLGLKGDWDLGENGWKTDNDMNLLKLSILTQGSALGVVAAEPGAPAQGDVVILNAAHATHPNAIAAYDEGAWVYIDPWDGVLLWNEDTGSYYRFATAGGWAELATGGGGGGTMAKLHELTLAADGDPIHFTAISQFYSDLLLVIYPVLTGGVGNKQVSLKLNGDAGANYDYRRSSPLEGEAANNSALGLVGQTGYSTTGNMPIECTIYDYANATSPEKFTRASSSDEGGGNFYMSWANMKWHPAVAAAINDILVNINNGVFKAGTRAVLYGRQ